MFSSQSNPTLYSTENLSNPNAPQIVQLDETERFEKTYPFNANGKISVSNVNGSIVVEAWDRNEIKLEAVKIADSKDRLKDVNIRIDSRRDFFKVETDYSAWKKEDGTWKNKTAKLEVQYKLSVPRTAILDQIGTVNGTVTISNMTGGTTASAVNGNVKVSNLRGNSELSTVNGVTEAEFESLAGADKISLSTVNGQVRLLLPSDADATIRANTVNGNIVNDLGLPVRRGRFIGRDMYGKIGSGQAAIRLESVAGQLSIRRKQDGKGLKPAVNLLNERSKNDQESFVLTSPIARQIAAARDQAERDANVDAESAVEDARRQREVARADSEKTMADAQKRAEKARVKLAPMPVMPAVIAPIDAEQLKHQIKVATTVQAVTMTNVNNSISWNWKTGAPVIEKKADTFKVDDDAKITVDAKNCRVSIRGWDKPEIHYSIIKLTRNGNPDVKTLDSRVNHDDSSVSIRVAETDPAEGTTDGDEVRVEVFVPKKSDLRILTNREIRVENVSGELNLTGAAGSIDVRDGEGRLTVASTEGNIRVIGFKGEIDSKSECGSISLEGEFEDLSARTDAGTIMLTLPKSASAMLESSSEINAEGFDLSRDGDDRWKLGDGASSYRLHTNDGQVIVRNINQLKNTY